MIIVNIVLGLIGLGIVIFVHELGHFLAARATGIGVDAFSLGWGKVLVSHKRKGTEYRLSLFPVGGYCKLKGEELYRRAVADDSSTVEPEEGSLFSVSPWRRILTFFAGPLANLIFAVLALSIIWFAGFTINTFDSKIILLSETTIAADTTFPADIAGLKTGDRIVDIDGHRVDTFRDLETLVTPNPGKTLSITVQRNGLPLVLEITPELNTETGAGRIGVAAWIDPIIASVNPGSAAEAAGLEIGDRMIFIDGKPVNHSLHLYAAMVDRPEKLDIILERNGGRKNARILVNYTENGETDLGFSFAGISVLERERNPFLAIGAGAKETFSTLILSVKSLGLLFRGVNLKNAVSGPIRITYFVGQVATQGFKTGLSGGLILLFRFLSFLSVALCFMNLLPIPALDGGMILLGLIEGIARKPVRPRIFYRYQIVGFVILLGILALTTVNDVFFFFNK